MRVGVGVRLRRDLADHVLGRRGGRARTVLAAVLRADASEMFLSEGIERVMNVQRSEQKDSANKLRILLVRIESDDGPGDGVP
jgi:hypothetical protein